MMRYFYGLCLLLVTACMQAPPATVVPDLTFENTQPVYLNVKSIEIVDEYRPPLKEPNIEHNYQLSPADAVKRLILRQFVANGQDKILRVIIEDAPVIKEDLPTTSGFWSNFTQEPAERFVAHLSLRFELVSQDSPDIILGHARVVADRSRSILKGASLADRDRAFFELTESLMKDMQESFSTIVKNTFSKV